MVAETAADPSSAFLVNVKETSHGSTVGASVGTVGEADGEGSTFLEIVLEKYVL